MVTLRVTLLTLVPILVLLRTGVSADYGCLCNYAVETNVMPGPSQTGSPIGIMYEFDCKPTISMAGLTKKFIAIAFQHELGYVAMDDFKQVQRCPGNWASADLITTSSSAATNTVTTSSKTTTSSPTPAVSTATTSTPTPAVSTATTSTPTPAVSTATTSTPTPAVSTATTSTPTPAVSTATTSAPTPAVSTATTSTPTPAVSTATTSTHPPVVSTTTTSTPTPAVSTATTSTPTPAVSTASTMVLTTSALYTATAAHYHTTSGQCKDTYACTILVATGYAVCADSRLAHTDCRRSCNHCDDTAALPVG